MKKKPEVKRPTKEQLAEKVQPFKEGTTFGEAIRSTFRKKKPKQ